MREPDRVGGSQAPGGVLEVQQQPVLEAGTGDDQLDGDPATAGLCHALPRLSTRLVQVRLVAVQNDEHMVVFWSAPEARPGIPRVGGDHRFEILDGIQKLRPPFGVIAHRA